MAEEKVSKTKIKKKKWIQVMAPALFRNEPIGEIPTYDPKSLIGRMVSVNLMSLTRDMKKQNTSLKLIITGIKSGGAVTDFYGYYLNASSIKRLVRRGKEKIGVSIVCKTADNKKVRIMPLIIPHRKVKGSVASSFRRDIVKYISSYVAKTTFENIIKELIMNKLQRDLKSALKKIYPVRIMEVAKIHIETEKKSAGKDIKVEEVPEETKEEEKVEEKKEEKPKVEEKTEEAKEKKEEKPKEEKAEKTEEEKPKEEEKKVEEEKAEKTEAPKEEKTEKPKEEKAEKKVEKPKVEEKKEEVKEEKPTPTKSE